jgi:uncharacterized membrane protein (DUF4010 family)
MPAVHRDWRMSAAVFAVIAIIVLPLLPQGPLGPYGAVRPRELGLFVVFFSGLSFAGYVARRIFGASHGYALAGLLAGIVSSTNATFTFARHSRTAPGIARPLALGAVAACTMLFPRVFIALLVLNDGVALALLPYVAMPVAIGIATLVWPLRASTVEAAGDEADNPLQLVSAVQMAATFQVVLIAVAWTQAQFGTGGLLASGAVLGLTDVDALTISMARSRITPQVAAQAIAIGVFVNCVMKSLLAVLLGTRLFGKVVGLTVGAMAVVIALSLVVGTLTVSAVSHP